MEAKQVLEISLSVGKMLLSNGQNPIELKKQLREFVGHIICSVNVWLPLRVFFCLL